MPTAKNADPTPAFISAAECCRRLGRGPMALARFVAVGDVRMQARVGMAPKYSAADVDKLAAELRQADPAKPTLNASA